MASAECAAGAICTSNPSVRCLWMTAWPMSRMVTSYWASISVMVCVRPGRSGPAMLMSTISFKGVALAALRAANGR